MKKVSLRLFSILTIAAALGAACTESVSTPISPSAATAAGNGSVTLSAGALAGTWRLLSIHAAGSAMMPAPPGAEYTLTLGDGRLSTRADCNLCNGSFSLSGDRLTAGPLLACTRAACPTMEFENAYTRMLSGEGTVALSGATLKVSSDRGVLQFTR
jgi:heat shock protein HslJ